MTMTIVEQLQQSISECLSELGISYDGTVHLEHPRELSHGDYATNIAMMLAKSEGKNPRELAEIIVEKLSEKHPEHSFSVAGPGFINIQFSREFFAGEVKNILDSGDNYGRNTLSAGKTILVEHSSPNLFKPFHIGHMMNNTIGESIVRLCKMSGAPLVHTISYPSDVSLGIGKAVYQLMKYDVGKIEGFSNLSEKINFLGRCYIEGTQAFIDTPDIEPRVREITEDIYKQRPTDAWASYQIARSLNLDYFRQMTDRLGSHFDGYIFESEAGIAGKKIVLEHTPGVYTESDGAIIYKPNEDEEKQGLHTRVFINKDGNPTYEAKDTGLLKLKFDRYQPDISIFVTDHEQGPYFRVVSTAAGKINSDWQDKTIHKTHGRMSFKGQKMSSRLGNTPIISDILDVVNEEVYERAGERTLTESQADIISIAALKYTILRTQAGKNINFDPETSLSFEGDSGPYLQYTYARAQSISKKASEFKINIDTKIPDSWQTTDLEKYLYRFPEIIELSFHELLPHHVVNYVTELAQYFNSWYGQGKIIDSDNPETGYKLALVQATAQVIKNGLWVLGIKAPEEM